jgi:hypothetical protein
MIEINLTPQEIFDKVAAHLLQQKYRCLDKKSLVCLYRNSQGMKCAAGCLISDEDYEPSLEGRSWRELVAMGHVSMDKSILISNLQVIHDTCEVEHWRDKLQDLAESHKLEFNF